MLNNETGSAEDVAVVVQAGGMKAITTGQESEEHVRALLDDGVSFKACSNTLDTIGRDESDLVEGVETVPKGAVDVMRLQTEGYAYMRP